MIARQEAKISFLESQVKLLKKLDMKERLLVAKGMNLSKDKLFELIKALVDNGLGRLVRYICKMSDVSRSGYYNYLNSRDARTGRSISDAKAVVIIKKAFKRKVSKRVLAPSK